MQQFRESVFTGERALFGKKDVEIIDGIFKDGESPLKECSQVSLTGSMFCWKYPLWYCSDIKAEKCTWLEMARAGVWYTKNITVKDSVIQAPKNFRRSSGITLENVLLSRAEETLWNCDNVKLKNVGAHGNYFAMNSTDIDVDSLMLDGNYAFDGGKNITVRDSRLITKDAFWNCENVTVYDSFIAGEYLGWNSKNLTFVNCTIESLQGMCYIDGLTMKNCRLIGTTLAFEYSSVEADIDSGIESVFNPKSGTIKAERIGELIMEKDKVSPEKTVITCRNIDKRSDRPEWLEGKN